MFRWGFVRWWHWYLLGGKIDFCTQRVAGANLCVREYSVVCFHISTLLPTRHTFYIYLLREEQACVVCACVYPSVASQRLKLFFSTMWSLSLAQTLRLGGKDLYPPGLTLLLPMHSLYLSLVSGKYTTELWALCTSVEILSVTLSEGSRLFIHVNMYGKICI